MGGTDSVTFLRLAIHEYGCFPFIKVFLNFFQERFHSFQQIRLSPLWKYLILLGASINEIALSLSSGWRNKMLGDWVA